MTIEAKGKYDVTSWDEAPYDEGVEGAVKLTKARITQVYSGDIEGQGTSDYLMVYPSDAEAYFVGMHRVVGSLGGRQGTFALQAEGSFGSSGVKVTWSVVPGSGTGELQGLSGTGGYSTNVPTTVELTLSYDLP